MTKAFIDTSGILRLLIKDDPMKAKADEKLLRQAKQQDRDLYLLPVALLEIVWVLEKNLAIVFTYDEKGFKRIEGLEVRKPR